MMECPTCHEVNEDNAVVCKKCGVILQDSKTPNVNNNNEPIKVKVVDIDMPFMSMVNFLAKLVLASIPAAIIVAIFALFFGGIIAAILHR